MVKAGSKDQKIKGSIKTMKKQKKTGPKEENTKKIILEAAISEFIEYGYYGARMQSIADRAKVNKAMIHYYFRNKETIYGEVINTVFDVVSEKLNKIPVGPVKPEKMIEQIQPEEIKKASATATRRVGKLTNIQKIQLIQQTINEQIRPALRAHGGNVELIDVEGNKVVVAFRGMCAQCTLADFTMKDVVEAKLKEFVSEELFVEEDKESAQQPHNHRE